ncbi:hypothetical protein [Methylorubrum populi]
MHCKRRAARRRGFRIVAIERRQRAKLDAPVAGQAAPAPVVSSKRRAELRRLRKRLAERGDLREVGYLKPAEVGAAFQDFLDLEAAGWKGRKSRRGRAIRNTPPLSAFAHRRRRGGERPDPTARGAGKNRWMVTRHLSPNRMASRGAARCATAHRMSFVQNLGTGPISTGPAASSF